MATAAVLTKMTLEQYLQTAFEPDAEFVDGVIEERNAGEWDHSRLQGYLNSLFMAKEEEWGVYSTVELRVRVAGSKVRIPDVCITDARNPVEQVPTKAPLLCLEVKSPEDRLPRMFKRIRDFHAMGVAQVWVFDPATQKVWVSTADGVTEWGGGVLRVPGTKIELDPAVAFARMVARRG